MSNIVMSDILSYAIVFLIFTNILLLINIKNIFRRTYVYLLIMLIIALICEISGHLMNRNGINNQPLFNGYILSEVFFLTLIAKNFVNGKSNFTFSILLAIAVFYWIYLSILNGLLFFHINSFIVNCVVITIMYLMVLIRITSKRIDGLLADPILWICISCIIYFGCDIPLFCLMPYFSKIKNTVLKNNIYNLNNILAIIRYLIILYSIWCLKRQSRKQL